MATGCEPWCDVEPGEEVGLTSARRAECLTRVEVGLASVSARLALASGETGCYDTAVVSKFGWERGAESEGKGHGGVLRC